MPLEVGIQKILIGKGPKDVGLTRGWNGKIGTVMFYNQQFSADTIELISADFGAIESVQSGVWDSPTTWDCNCVPNINSTVTINNGHQVEVNEDYEVKNVPSSGDDVVTW